jgi:hypothetical protein
VLELKVFGAVPEMTPVLVFKLRLEGSGVVASIEYEVIVVPVEVGVALMEAPGCVLTAW